MDVSQRPGRVLADVLVLSLEGGDQGLKGARVLDLAPTIGQRVIGRLPKPVNPRWPIGPMRA
jgi:hypothetical protein